MSRALVLFSGGLDSILAARLLMVQGVEVLALRFVTPFFAADVGDPERYAAAIRKKYGIPVLVRDLSHDFMGVLRAPAHGFGRNFNPCIDCKILMLRKARELLAELGADFLATGEVLGQRPMSQRRDAMRSIERESGCEGLLLRPLCAQLMQPTEPEQKGLVDRERLGSLSGRGRTGQQQLAASLGITEYPAPAGGCLLTDVNLCARFRHFAPGIFNLSSVEMQVESFRLLLFGRHFAPGPGLWLTLGRDQGENDRLSALREPEDWLLTTVERPGPLGLLRSLGGTLTEASLTAAAGLVLRYAKKVNGRAEPGLVRIRGKGFERESCFAPLDEESAQELQGVQETVRGRTCPD